MLLLFGFTTGIFLSSFPISLITYIISKIMRFSFVHIKMFCFMLRRTNRKYRFSFCPFYPGCIVSMIKKDITDREDKIVSYTSLIGFIAFCIFLCIYLFYFRRNDIDLFENDFLTFSVGIAIGMSFFCVGIIISTIDRIKNGSKYLQTYLRSEIKKLNSPAATFSSLNLPPLSQMTASYKMSEIDMQSYQLLRFTKLTYENNYNELFEVVSYLENAVDNANVLAGPVINACTSLVFYYSYISYDHDKAWRFYDRISYELKHDLEPGSFRVRAYYEYYVTQNIQLARELASSGIDSLNYSDIMYPCELEIEKNLLYMLANTIDTYYRPYI